jgi:hypothetical protein
MPTNNRFDEIYFDEARFDAGGQAVVVARVRRKSHDDIALLYQRWKLIHEYEPKLKELV